MTLTGLFFYRECGDHYHTGEIGRQVHPDAYLVRYDTPANDMPVNPMVLMTVTGDLSDFTDDDREPAFRFFETRSELQLWVTWLESPVKAPTAVISLVGKGKKH